MCLSFPGCGPPDARFQEPNLTDSVDDIIDLTLGKYR
jgi:hypothetical protein